MDINATHIAYYHICRYKLWLFANGIRMEHTSGTVYEGKLIHRASYSQRPKRYSEVSIDGCKIDYYDRYSKKIHEVKRSNKMEEVHIWQLKYYIFILLKNGIRGVTGILEYPLAHERKKVVLESGDQSYLRKIVYEVQLIISAETPPAKKRKAICTSCSYHDFCYC